MDQNEVTIKQIADQCGVSKSTAVRKFKELDLPVITRGGKGTVFLGPEAASALAHALMKSRIPEVTADQVSEILDLPTPAPVASVTVPTPAPAYAEGTQAEAVRAYDPERDTMLEMYREQIRSLSKTNELLREQINQLNMILEVVRTQHESTLAVLSDQIDHLNEQIVALQKEKDKMREDLAMSRALEGFHFPWQRDRIVSRYLLPSTQTSDADEATYEG